MAIGALPQNIGNACHILNKIRNKIAHDLKHEITDDKLEQILSELPPDERKTVRKDMDDVDGKTNLMEKKLSILLRSVMAGVEVSRHFYKVRLLKMERAFENARKVLEETKPPKMEQNTENR